MIKKFEEFTNASEIVTEGKFRNFRDRIASAIHGAVNAFKIDKKWEKMIGDEWEKILKNTSEYNLDIQYTVCIEKLFSTVMNFMENFAEEDDLLINVNPRQIEFYLKELEKDISVMKEIVEKSKNNKTDN